jgi:hypothetical protein
MKDTCEALQELATINHVIVSVLGHKGQSQRAVKIQNLEPEDGSFRVEVTAEWTSWQRRQYSGVDLAECVDLAYTDYLCSLTEPEIDTIEPVEGITVPSSVDIDTLFGIDDEDDDEYDEDE